jgi:hypothetical protein
MNDEFDIQRFAEVPDPFVATDMPAPRRVDPKGMPQSPTRARAYALRVVAAVSAIVVDTVWVMFVKHRPDLGSLSPSQLVIGLAIPCAAMALALGALGRSGEHGLGERKARLLALLIGSPALFVAATLLSAPPDARDGRFWHHAVGCFLVTAILAGVPLAIGAYAFRRAFATSAAWRMCALGVASGAAAAATMSLACPVSSAGHVLVGHGAMMLLAGAVGAWVGERVGRA